MIASMPQCTHPPLPVHIAALTTIPGKTANRPFATIIMTVDASGRVIGARIDESSGDRSWDEAAELTARQWEFRPASDGCKSVAGTAEYAVGTGPDVTFAYPCEHNADIHARVTPQLPAQLYGATVQIDLDPVGRVTSATLMNSSRSDLQDQATYTAALNSTYLPAVHACKPDYGEYWFTIPTAE